MQSARYVGFTALACLSTSDLASAAATMESIGAEKCGAPTRTGAVEGSGEFPKLIKPSAVEITKWAARSRDNCSALGVAWPGRACGASAPEPLRYLGVVLGRSEHDGGFV